MPRNPPILLVDNDPLLRDDLRRLLEAEGFRVVRSCPGADAAEAIREGAFGLMVIDVLLPGRGTIDALVEHSRGSSGCPIVAISKSDRPMPPYYEALIRRLGVRAILTLPFDRAELAAAMRAAVGGPPEGFAPPGVPSYSFPS